MKKRTMALLAAMLMIVGVMIGSTLAWLTAKSSPVVNTFTTSDIEIELKETTGADYKMVPGWPIDKDPKVTVLAESEECYLFVKLEKNPTSGEVQFDDYLEYTVDKDWEELNSEKYPGVYYREITKDGIGKPYSVLKDDKIFVKETVTKEMMAKAKNNKPTLTITAYASQLYGKDKVKFGAEEAWTNIK